MMHHLLPRLHPQLYEQLNVQKATTGHEASVSHSLAFYLNDIKNSLHDCQDEWDAYKKITNTYEYIHSIVPGRKQCVSRLHPLSRSYYKMIEIAHCFQLLSVPSETDRAPTDLLPPPPGLEGANHRRASDHPPAIWGVRTDEPIATFHLAEGPGGFIQAIADLRAHPRDVYHGMTLVVSDKNEDIPGWKKSRQFLRDHPNVVIETGCDGTGNMLSMSNFEHVVHTFIGSMDLITADGGFDFSSDFSHQEANASHLIFAQIAYAVCLQRTGGSFVLKVFDMFTKYTLDMVALLSSLYQQVYVTKPVTSRCANSEKYLVCKGYIGDGVKVYPYMRETLQVILSREEGVDVCGILPTPLIPRAFVNKLEEYNAILGQQQIENIHLTLQLMYSNDRKRAPDERRPIIQNMIRKNVYRCVQWCIKHDIPHDVLFSPLHP